VPEPAVGIREVDDPAALEPNGWSDLVGPEDFFLSREWLTITQATAGVPMRYLTVDRDGVAVAGVSIAFAGTGSPWLLGRTDTLLARCVAEGRPGAAEVVATLPAGMDKELMPGLVCGGRHLGRTRMLLGPDAGLAEAQLLMARVEAIAGESGARSICFPYLDERDTTLRAVLHERGFLHHESGEFATLALPPGGFAGYLASLSRHRAERIRAERRVLSAAGVQTTVEEFAAEQIERLAVLETELFQKYGMTGAAPKWSAYIFHVIAENLGDRAQVCLARQGEDIIGFSLLLAHGDQWFAHRGGFDYGRQSRLPLYFETGYYRPIEFAAQLGMTTIHYGIGSMAAKRSRGCRATTQYSYLKWLA
jgi:uncharacterized protein